MKCILYRIRLTTQGYEVSTGRYFGVGEPVFYYEPLNEENNGDYLRAYDREHAKRKIQKLYPNISFFR